MVFEPQRDTKFAALHFEASHDSRLAQRLVAQGQVEQKMEWLLKRRLEQIFDAWKLEPHVV